MYCTKVTDEQAERIKPGNFVKLDKMNVMLVVFTILGVALLGCNTMLDRFTPAPVDSVVTDYIDANVPTFMGFTTLYYVRHMEIQIRLQHQVRQMAFIRMIEDDNLKHSFAKSYNDASKLEGQTIQDIVVGSEGNPFSIAGLLATAAPGLLVGRALKRKQDYTPEQVKKLAKDVEERTIAKLKLEKTENV
jgi:hypothetical protein